MESITDLRPSSRTFDSIYGNSGVGAAEVFQAHAREGFDWTTTALFAKSMYQKSQEDEMQSQGLDPFMKLDQAGYEESGYFRKDIQFEEGMTLADVAVLSTMHDDRARRQMIIQDYEGGNEMALALGGQLTGSLADPINFISIAGLAKKAKLGAVVDDIARATARPSKWSAFKYEAAENIMMVAMTEPAVMEQLNREGARVGLDDMAMDLAMAGAIGGTIGAGREWLRGVATPKEYHHTENSVLRALESLVEEGHISHTDVTDPQVLAKVYERASQASGNRFKTFFDDIGSPDLGSFFNKVVSEPLRMARDVMDAAKTRMGDYVGMKRPGFDAGKAQVFEDFEASYTAFMRDLKDMPTGEAHSAIRKLREKLEAMRQKWRDGHKAWSVWEQESREIDHAIEANSSVRADDVIEISPAEHEMIFAKKGEPEVEVVDPGKSEPRRGTAPKETIVEPVVETAQAADVEPVRVNLRELTGEQLTTFIEAVDPDTPRGQTAKRERVRRATRNIQKGKAGPTETTPPMDNFGILEASMEDLDKSLKQAEEYIAKEEAEWKTFLNSWGMKDVALTRESQAMVAYVRGKVKQFMNFRNHIVVYDRVRKDYEVIDLGKEPGGMRKDWEVIIGPKKDKASRTLYEKRLLRELISKKLYWPEDVLDSNGLKRRGPGLDHHHFNKLWDRARNRYRTQYARVDSVDYVQQHDHAASGIYASGEDGKIRLVEGIRAEKPGQTLVSRTSIEVGDTLVIDWGKGQADPMVVGGESGAGKIFEAQVLKRFEAGEKGGINNTKQSHGGFIVADSNGVKRNIYDKNQVEIRNTRIVNADGQRVHMMHERWIYGGVLKAIDEKAKRLGLKKKADGSYPRQADLTSTEFRDVVEGLVQRKTKDGFPSAMAASLKTIGSHFSGRGLAEGQLRKTLAGMDYHTIVELEFAFIRKLERLEAQLQRFAPDKTKPVRDPATGGSRLEGLDVKAYTKEDYAELKELQRKYLRTSEELETISDVIFERDRQFGDTDTEFGDFGRTRDTNPSTKRKDHDRVFVSGDEQPTHDPIHETIGDPYTGGWEPPGNPEPPKRRGRAQLEAEADAILREDAEKNMTKPQSEEDIYQDKKTRVAYDAYKADKVSLDEMDPVASRRIIEMEDDQAVLEQFLEDTMWEC